MKKIKIFFFSRENCEETKNLFSRDFNNVKFAYATFIKLGKVSNQGGRLKYFVVLEFRKKNHLKTWSTILFL